MSISLNEIQAPIASEMQLFEKKFRASMKTRVLLLDRIMSYIVKRKGKQMRPMFVFFTAKLFQESITDATYRGAALIELLHTATLVHDDVVDDANYRRGFFSVNALWKNKIAVLVGDYLLSKGLLLSLQNDDYELLKIVSNAVKEMSEGELLQIEKARRLDITEDVYFDIIRQKTAGFAGQGHGLTGDAADFAEQMLVPGRRLPLAGVKGISPGRLADPGPWIGAGAGEAPDAQDQIGQSLVAAIASEDIGQLQKISLP